jgi:site-specific recombinase XerD
MFQHQLIRKNHYARPASIQDLLTISDDLNGNLKEFLIECDNNNLAPATITYYQQMIGWFLDFLKEGNVTKVGQILPQHITIYNLHRKDSGWKSISIATSFRAIRRFCMWLVEAKKIEKDHNPCEGLKQPKYEKKVIKPFTDGEINALLLINANRSTSGHTEWERKLCITRNKAIILLYLDTAIRLREMSAIFLSDIDLPSRSIRIMGKGAKERIVTFSPKTKTALTQYIICRNEHKDLALWIGILGKPLTRWGICQIMRSFKLKAGFTSGVRCSSHTMRHTSAMSCLRNGMGELTLKYMLGHETLHTTQIYTQSLGGEDVAKAMLKCSPVDHLQL